MSRVQVSPVPLFPIGKELYSTVCLLTQVYKLMGTGDIAVRGNPAMDWHPVQGGVVIFLGMLHAKETMRSLCVPLQFIPLPRIEIIERFGTC